MPPNLVVTSYEVLRADVGYLSAIPWGYVVLDEGHVIRNPKSAVSVAAKQLRARFRLLMSGTPV